MCPFMIIEQCYRIPTQKKMKWKVKKKLFCDQGPGINSTNWFAPYAKQLAPYAQLLRSYEWRKSLAFEVKDRHRVQNTF